MLHGCVRLLVRHGACLLNCAVSFPTCSAITALFLSICSSVSSGGGGRTTFSVVAPGLNFTSKCRSHLFSQFTKNLRVICLRFSLHQRTALACSRATSIPL